MQTFFCWANGGWDMAVLITCDACLIAIFPAGNDDRFEAQNNDCHPQQSFNFFQ